PVTFDEVVGQEHVKDVLTSAVARGLTGHAYLFSGPRGVGKTTTARLLAMAVNCEREDPTERPCGTCESCRLVQGGGHPDVIELDAASNNSVEDVRDLRERVGLASLRGGTRVWILDEAHMLTRAAANARAGGAPAHDPRALPALPLPAPRRRRDPRQARPPLRGGGRQRRGGRAVARRPRRRGRDARRRVAAREAPGGRRGHHGRGG